MSRLAYNKAILTIMSNYIEEHPQLRFGQVLWNLDVLTFDGEAGVLVRDPYDDEPVDILKRVSEAYYG